MRPGSKPVCRSTISTGERAVDFSAREGIAAFSSRIASFGPWLVGMI
jgi:hypothetical protein